jgi:hypothetical protein
MGCDQIQGYYFSPPVDARTITSMLLQGPPWEYGDRRAASDGRSGADCPDARDRPISGWRWGD